MCLCALLLGNQVYSMNAKIYVHCNITLQRVYGSEVNLKPPKSMLPYLHPPNTANAFFISVTYFLFHIVPLCVLFCFVFYYQFVATDWNLDISLFFFSFCDNLFRLASAAQFFPEWSLHICCTHNLTAKTHEVHWLFRHHKMLQRLQHILFFFFPKCC